MFVFTTMSARIFLFGRYKDSNFFELLDICCFYDKKKYNFVVKILINN